MTISLSHLSALAVPPLELIDLAARAGFDHVGFRLVAPEPGMPAYGDAIEGQALRALRSKLRDGPVRLLDVEVLTLNASGLATEWDAVFPAAADLGARFVLVAAGEDLAGDPLADAFASLCERLDAHGLTAALEFMPWTTVPSLRRALALLKAAGEPSNARLVIDNLHLASSGGTSDELALARGRIAYMQLSDVDAVVLNDGVEQRQQARYNRLLPGDGMLDVVDCVAHASDDVPLTLEANHQQIVERIGVDAWVRQGREKIRRIETIARVRSKGRAE